jgi:hypothetical protein
MRLRFFIILYTSFLCTSCSKKMMISESEMKKIILDKYEKVRTSLKNGDPNYVLDLHTKDAILFLPNGKEVTGIKELRPFYEGVAQAKVDIKSTPTNIEIFAHDIVFEVGTYTSTSQTGVQNSAKYINIWRKIDGDWKLFKAIDQAKL